VSVAYRNFRHLKEILTEEDTQRLLREVRKDTPDSLAGPAKAMYLALSRVRWTIHCQRVLKQDKKRYEQTRDLLEKGKQLNIQEEAQEEF